MATANPNRRGNVSLNIWVEPKTHQACKERLAREGKTFRELVTKFLRWYGGTEDVIDEKTDEAAKADRQKS